MQSNHRLLIILILSILTGAYVFKQMQPLSPASSQAKSAQENILLSARFNALDGSEQALNQWQGNILVLNFGQLGARLAAKKCLSFLACTTNIKTRK